MSKCTSCGFSEALCPCGERRHTPPTSSVASGDITFRWAADDRPEHVRWLIRGLIPAHALVLLTGREGTGKSTLAGRWLADASIGVLSGDWHGQPMASVVMAVEDSWHSRWLPRLRAYGADLSAVARDPSFSTVDDDGQEVLDVVSLTDDDHLRRLGEASQAAGVGWLYLDHLSEALDVGANQNAYGEMVTALKRLNVFARRYEVSVLAGWHLGKGQGPIADKIIGSVGIRSTARAVLTVADDPQTGLRWLAATKSNDLAGDAPAWSFTITPTVVDVDSESYATTVASQPEVADHPGTGRDWVQQLLDRGASADRPEDDSGSPMGADQWLRDFLGNAGGAVMKSFAVAHGEAAGFSERSVERAAERIGVLTALRGRRAEWRLTDDSHTTSASGESGAVGGGGEGRHASPRPQHPPRPPRPPRATTSAKPATGATRDGGGRRKSQPKDVPTGTVIDLNQLRNNLETP